MKKKRKRDSVNPFWVASRLARLSRTSTDPTGLLLAIFLLTTIVDISKGRHRTSYKNNNSLKNEPGSLLQELIFYIS